VGVLEADGALESAAPPDEVRVAPEIADGISAPPSLLRRLDVQRRPEVRSALEHPRLFAAAAQLLGAGEVETTEYKWLRAVPPGKFTGPHMDRAYVGAGSRLTAWIPLGDVAPGPGGSGALCWVPRSHVDTRVVSRYADYKSAGADGERSGWLAPDPAALALPEGCIWRTTHFAMGDVAVFGMDLLHSTVPNDSQNFRLSCDTRWQPVGSPAGSVHVGPWQRRASHSRSTGPRR